MLLLRHFFEYKKAFDEQVTHCSGRPGFIYCFQNENMETYEEYLKPKKDFPFTVTRDSENTKGYIPEIEGGSMFATFYVLMFNFHPKLNMTPNIYLRSFGQSENEVKHITISEKLCKCIDHNDITCFADACDRVLRKEQKQAISSLCALHKKLSFP